MGDVNLTWNADAITRRLEEALVVGLGNAGQVMHRRADQLVSKPYPPASAPGEPPRMRSGDLRKGLAVWVERISGGGIVHMGWRRGRPDYAEHLAGGTRRMKARPTMPAVLESRGADVVQTVAEALRRALR